MCGRQHTVHLFTHYARLIAPGSHATAASSNYGSAGDPNAGELLAKANDAYEAAGGPTADKRVANVLSGLGFSQQQYTKLCSEFSGGWQVRRQGRL